MRFWAFTPGGDLNLSGFDGTIGWAIHANNAGVPGTVLFSGASTSVVVTNTGVNGVGGSRIFQLDVNVGAVALPAGTYWWQFREGAINSLSDGTLVSLTGTGQPTAFLNGLRFDTNETNPTFSNSANTDIAFELYSVPEPASVGGIVLAAAGLLRRRQPLL